MTFTAKTRKSQKKPEEDSKLKIVSPDNVLLFYSMF